VHKVGESFTFRGNEQKSHPPRRPLQWPEPEEKLEAQAPLARPLEAGRPGGPSRDERLTRLEAAVARLDAAVARLTEQVQNPPPQLQYAQEPESRQLKVSLFPNGGPSIPT
jgi:hypothetical protein